MDQKVCAIRKLSDGGEGHQPAKAMFCKGVLQFAAKEIDEAAGQAAAWTFCIKNGSRSTEVRERVIQESAKGNTLVRQHFE